MEKTAVIGQAQTIVWVLVGIIFSLLLPVAVRTLKSAKLEGSERRTFGQRLANTWNRLGGTRYLMIGIAAIFVALVLVFLLGLEFTMSRDAVLAGFAWESFVNKLMASPNDGSG